MEEYNYQTSVDLMILVDQMADSGVMPPCLSMLEKQETFLSMRAIVETVISEYLLHNRYAGMVMVYA